jgi:hypothetical protein
LETASLTGAAAGLQYDVNGNVGEELAPNHAAGSDDNQDAGQSHADQAITHPLAVATVADTTGAIKDFELHAHDALL